MSGKKSKTKKVKSTSNHTKKKTWAFVLILILVLVSFATFVLLTDNKVEDLFNFKTKAITPADKKTEIVVFGDKKDILEDSVTQAIEQALDQSTDQQKALMPDEPTTQEEPVISEPTISESVQTFESGNFYLVAGSFKSKKNAETMKSQLDRKGLKAEIIENHFYYVVIGRFSNKESATQQKNKIREKHDQAVWVMEKQY